MPIRSRLRLLCGLLLALTATLLVTSGASAADLGLTSIGFEASVLQNLGIEVESQATATPLVSGQVAFAVAASSDLSFIAPGADFEGFAGGVLRHHAELALIVSGQVYVLSDFELRVAPDPLNLELFDATGRRWFRFENSQPSIERGELRLRNVDVNMAPELAALLGRPELAGSYLGQADLRIVGEPESFPPAPLAIQGAGPCDDVFTADRDVSLLAVGTVSQLAREAGGRVALTFSALLRNTGMSAIVWKRSIEPDGPAANVGEHPFLALHVYRILNGRITQVGRSDVKHAFFAANTNCSCAGGHVIYPNCEDLYGASTNSNRTYMAPREEVTVGSGVWSRVGSHFDAIPVDDFRHHGGNPDHDDFEHRLVVAESDLQTGGSYFVEAWYIISGDVDLFNSMGHDAVSPSFSGSTWSFSTLGALVSGSILDEFVDPVSPPEGSTNRVYDTGEGRLQLAVATTDLGGGELHYEYALMNYDFDRQVRSFSVPLDSRVAVSNIAFSDGDTDASNDWTASVATSEVTWSAPAGSELDWGMLYSFGFDADVPAGDTVVSLEVLESGAPQALAVDTLGPMVIALVPLQGVAARLLLLALLGTGGVAALARGRRDSPLGPARGD